MINGAWYQHNFPELFGLPPKPPPRAPSSSPPVSVEYPKINDISDLNNPVIANQLGAAEKYQRIKLKTQGLSDGAIDHIYTHGTESIVAPSPAVAHVGTEPVYNFDVTDHYGGSLPTSATREERIVAEGRKSAAATAALQQALVKGENVQTAMQQVAHTVGETVEQQKANDLLYATIEQANRQIQPNDVEQYGFKSLNVPSKIVGDPEAIHKYLAQISPLTISLYLRWEATWYKPSKKPGGLIGKIGREFNKGLGNMGPIGKIVKPLIHLAAVASGNPWAPIATSVGTGALDRSAEGAVKGLLPGLMGAVGQQIAIAQQAGIPLVGEGASSGTLVVNPEAAQIAQDLRALTTEQLLIQSQSPMAAAAVQTINLTEETIKTACYMAPMAYSYAMELTAATGDSIHDAQIKKKRKEFYRSLAGMGLGTLASTAFISSTSTAFLSEGQNSFVIALGGGAILGSISSGISRRKPIKGALEGTFIAGAGNIIGRGLSSSEYLKEAYKLREALGIAASSTIHIMVRHGKLKDILIGVSSDVLGYAIVPPGIGVLNDDTLRIFLTGAIAALASNAELGETIIASWLGSNVQRLARQYGNDIARSHQGKKQPKPVKSDKSEKGKSLECAQKKDDRWRSNALNVATKKASEVLASKNIQVSEKRVRQTFERQPILQGSKEQVQQNLITLGKADGPVKNNRSAFIKGLESI